MKVAFDGKQPTVHLRSGLQLVPGANEVPEGVGREMVAAGLARCLEEAPPAREATAPPTSPSPASADPVPVPTRKRSRPEEDKR